MTTTSPWWAGVLRCLQERLDTSRSGLMSIPWFPSLKHSPGGYRTTSRYVWTDCSGVLCPRWVPAWSGCMASYTLLTATCPKPATEEGKEREKAAGAWKGNRKNVWKQSETELVWHFSACTITQVGCRQCWCYLKVSLLSFWEEWLETTLRVEPGMM